MRTPSVQSWGVPPSFRTITVPCHVASLAPSKTTFSGSVQQIFAAWSNDGKTIVVEEDGTIRCEGTAEGNAGIKLANPSNVSITNFDQAAKICWTDPENVVFEGARLATFVCHSLIILLSLLCGVIPKCLYHITVFRSQGVSVLGGKRCMNLSAYEHFFQFLQP